MAEQQYVWLLLQDPDIESGDHSSDGIVCGVFRSESDANQAMSNWEEADKEYEEEHQYDVRRYEIL